MAERGLDYLQGEARRAFDIGVASGLLALGALPTLAVAGVTMRDHGMRGLLFRQGRHWPRNPNFAVTKFRTIPAHMTDLINTVEDDRASRLGNVFRRSGLDEIPQLFSVLRGTMTVIGIRPIVDQDLEQRESADPALFSDWYEYYKQLRPAFSSVGGLYYHTIDEGGEQTVNAALNIEVMRRDVGYVERASLAHDMRVMGQMASTATGSMIRSLA